MNKFNVGDKVKFKNFSDPDQNLDVQTYRRLYWPTSNEDSVFTVVETQSSVYDPCYYISDGKERQAAYGWRLVLAEDKKNYVFEEKEVKTVTFKSHVVTTNHAQLYLKDDGTGVRIFLFADASDTWIVKKDDIEDIIEYLTDVKERINWPT